MSPQVTYEIDHIPVLRDFLCILYGNLKEKDHIKRKINSKKRGVYIGNQYYYYYYFRLPKIRVCRARTINN